jgi:hypothetical protein
VRAALESTVGAGAASGLRLVVNLRSYWIMRSQLGEARRWLDRALAVPHPPDPDRTVALWMAAGVAVLQGDVGAAHVRLAEGRAEAAVAGNDRAPAYLDHVTGAAALVEGDLEAARPLLHRAHEVLSELADPDLMAMSSWFMLPLVELFAGDVQAALSLCKQGCDACLARGELWTRSCLHWVEGLAYLSTGDVAGGVRASRQALATKLQLDDPLGITITVEQLAWLAGVRGDHVAAATLLGAATRQWRAVGRPWFGFEGLLALRAGCAERAREALGEQQFAEAFSAGESMDTRGAAARALTVTA